MFLSEILAGVRVCLEMAKRRHLVRIGGSVPRFRVNYPVKSDGCPVKPSVMYFSEGN